MIPYHKWPIVHSDPFGFEARRNPEDPEEYAINDVRVGEEVLPMLFLPRGTLRDITTTTMAESYGGIIRASNQGVGGNEEFARFVKGLDKKGFNGSFDSILFIDSFLKSTLIRLVKEETIIV